MIRRINDAKHKALRSTFSFLIVMKYLRFPPSSLALWIHLSDLAVYLRIWNGGKEVLDSYSQQLLPARG
jgi:hypothetical protein